MSKTFKDILYTYVVEIGVFTTAIIIAVGTLLLIYFDTYNKNLTKTQPQILKIEILNRCHYSSELTSVCVQKVTRGLSTIK